MSLGFGIAALVAASVVIRVVPRPPGIAGLLVVLAVCLVVPAAGDLGETIGAARDKVEHWQAERIRTGSCYARGLSALEAGDEQRLTHVSRDCEQPAPAYAEPR